MSKPVNVSGNFLDIIKKASSDAEVEVRKVRRHQNGEYYKAAEKVSESLEQVKSMLDRKELILKKCPEALKQAVIYRPMVYSENGEGLVGDTRIIELLIVRGVKVNTVFESDGTTPFILAVNGKKTDVNVVTYSNSTAYSYAKDLLKYGNECGDLLPFLEDIEELDKDLSGRYRLCAKNWNNFMKTKSEIIEPKIIDEFVTEQEKDRNLSREVVLNLRVNDQNRGDADNYNTPLHLIAALKRTDLFYHMLTIGACMGVPNRKGQTAEDIIGYDKVHNFMVELKSSIDSGTGFPHVVTNMVIEYLIPKSKTPDVNISPTDFSSLVSKPKSLINNNI
jgi:hypothetical protein